MGPEACLRFRGKAGPPSTEQKRIYAVVRNYLKTTNNTLRVNQYASKNNQRNRIAHVISSLFSNKTCLTITHDQFNSIQFNSIYSKKKKIHTVIRHIYRTCKVFWGPLEKQSL